MDLSQQKAAIRGQIKAKLSALTSHEKKSQSEAICDSLRAFLHQNITGLCAFVPLTDEPDIRLLLREILTRGIPLFLPRYEESKVTFHRVMTLSGLQPGALGVSEPPAGSPQPDPLSISHVLVPGRAFDRRGNRLGRGKGGYDGWIKGQRMANPKTRFLGIAFREQLVEAVPVEGHDQEVDRVISSDGGLRT